MAASAPPFDMHDTSFSYDGNAYCQPLSPEDSNNNLSSSPPLSWDMSVYPDDPNGVNSCASNSSGGSNKRSQKRGISTFITKLYGMVCDRKNQQLISWNPSGTSFLVCNATRFSLEVLPEHFKHSNFSSFVRQLNMYGFHKINKSLRGQRGCNENEIWEFSHGKFQYGRPDLLEDIKRKAMDSELLRRETGDIHASFAMVQLSQSDLLQQFTILQDNFSNLLQSFEELKKTQLQQQIIIRRLAESSGTTSPQKKRPNVLVTAPQWQQHHNNFSTMCSVDSMNIPSSDIHCLPPSPAPSDPLSHSHSSSFNSNPLSHSRTSPSYTSDPSFSREHSSHENTIDLTFST